MGHFHHHDDGEEEPLRCPVMFRSAGPVVINKIDHLPHLAFDMGLFLGNLRRVDPAAAVLQVSARTGTGVDEWLHARTTASTVGSGAAA